MEDNELIIDNINYRIEDEELDTIEYYEIVSLDEIIKNNPTFIAYSKEELYNELYDFFKKKSKVDNVIDLIYDTIGNKQDIINYILVGDVVKKDYGCFGENIEELINNIKTLNKSTQYFLSKEQKNKLFFALTYDSTSGKLRYKPHSKTIIQYEDKNINIFYPIYPTDDTNIPISAMYYRIPTSTNVDYLSEKVIAHLEPKIDINLTNSDGIIEINKLIEVVKPKIEDVINSIKLDPDSSLDYSDINNIMARFDMSFDTINIEEIDKLRIILDDFKKIKEHKFIPLKYKIKEIEYTNSKYQFFEKSGSILLLLDFVEKESKEYDEIISKLQDKLININAPQLVYNNINDIVTAVAENVMSLEDIIDNIAKNREILILQHNIETLKNITTNDFENIKIMYDKLLYRFTLLKNNINEISNLHFIDFYKELKDIKEGADNESYEGIPDVYKNQPLYEDGMDEVQDNEDIEDFMNKNYNKYDESHLEKFWLNIKYKDSIGFIESLKIIIIIIDKIQKVSKLPINYEILCEELFNYYRGIPDKYEIFISILNDEKDTTKENHIRDMIKLTPEYVINSQVSDDNLSQTLYECNIAFINNLFNILNRCIAIWSLNIQEDILNNNILFDENLYDIAYIDKWEQEGLPIKESKNGVLVYISSIYEDIMIENKKYTIPKNIINNVMEIIRSDYKDKLEDLKKININDKKKIDKGKETHIELVKTIQAKQFDKLVNDYVNALIYMPSYKYKKVHKFLLGCCLQKIDKNFKPDSDLIGSRNDLMAAKKKYARHRESNKKRIDIYLPYKEDEEIIEMIKYEKPREIEEDSGIKNIKDWIDNIKGKSSLFPDIEELSKGTKILETYTRKYITILTNTTGYKRSELPILFNDVYSKYKQILNKLCVLFNKQPNHKELFNNNINDINFIIDKIDDLNKYINKYNRQDIIRIKEYIIARALCLPCNPDDSINNILISPVDSDNNFIFNISREVHNLIVNYLINSKMPTNEDNVKFINVIREQNKNKILSMMNSKSQDDRDLMLQLKKIGMKYDDEEQQNINGERIEEDGEQEFVVKDEGEVNEDDLDNEDYGFIYA